MHLETLDKLRSMIAEQGWDALVCLSPENIAYSAGFVVPSQTLMRWRHAALVLTRDDVAMVCVDMEEATVRRERPDWEVRTWGEFTENPMDVLAATLAELGVREGVVGIELDYLAVSNDRRLRDASPTTTFVAADQALTGARRIKSATELARLESLSRISERSILDALASVRAGDTEMDIAATLTSRIFEQGAENFKLMIVATGERSQLPNVGPTTRRLEPGDICRVEIFSVAAGYQAGVCRTAVVGEPSAQAQRVYDNLVECKRLVLESIKPGVSARSVYEVYRRHFDSLGMPAIGFVGHSIGVNLHESPYLGPYGEEELGSGMVLGIEPLVYRSGHGFGMQIKDMVAVDDGECRLLSDLGETDRMVVIDA